MPIIEFTRDDLQMHGCCRSRETKVQQTAELVARLYTQARGPVQTGDVQKTTQRCLSTTLDHLYRAESRGLIQRIAWEAERDGFRWMPAKPHPVRDVQRFLGGRNKQLSVQHTADVVSRICVEMGGPISTAAVQVALRKCPSRTRIHLQRALQEGVIKRSRKRSTLNGGYKWEPVS